MNDQSLHVDVITPEQAQTLHGLFELRVARSPQTIAFRYFDPRSRQWEDLTWKAAAQQVARYKRSLAAERLQTGDRVAVMMRNCPSWVFFEQAALALGLVVVPLFPNDRPENIAYIVNDAQIKLLFLENDDQGQNVIPVMQGFPDDFRLICIQPLKDMSDRRIQKLDDWLKISVEPTVPSVTSKDLATIVYTSGTTGRPKGVMLSHWNILTNVYSGIRAITVYDYDLFLSFLPLSHTLERTVGYYIPMLCGSTVAFARSVADLAEDLVTIRPTVLISVPRIFERVYAKISTQLQEKSPLARRLFNLAVDVGWNRFEYQQKRAPWRLSFLLWPVLKALVAKKILAKLGGRMRFSICGGAALSTPIARTFIGLGLPICQGYGLTESSPVISVNRLEDNIPASIGPALPDIEVKLAPNGELLSRNSSIMLGYWGMPDATKQVIDSEGWLHTGDLAKIGPRGHIYITGRIKEILVLANGEKVPPVDMEMAIMLDPLFEQVMVMGEGKAYLCALVVLNEALWKEFAQQHGMSAAPTQLNDARAQVELLNRLVLTLKQFPGYAQIRKITPTLEPWTVENELMTPSLKLRRGPLMKKFEKNITAMYEGH